MHHQRSQDAGTANGDVRPDVTDCGSSPALNNETSSPAQANLRHRGGASAQRVSVTDGRRALGVVIQRDSGYEAITVGGLSVGTFLSEPDAATELWRHDRGCPAPTRRGNMSPHPLPLER